MVLFSDSVNDILMILNTLVSVCPSVVAVLELFYFLCLVFYKMWMEEKLPQKYVILDKIIIVVLKFHMKKMYVVHVCKTVKM